MKPMQARSSAARALAAAATLAWACGWMVGQQPKRPDPPPAGQAQSKPAASTEAGELRPIRVAVFDLDVLKGAEMEAGALTDQVNTMLAAIPKVTIVNRDQIHRVAEEHKMALAGLVDSASAAKLGKFLSAQYVIVGRASKIEQTHYLVLKIVDVQTTVQWVVSAKAAAEEGVQALLDRLKAPLAERIRQLQQPSRGDDEEAALAKLRQAAKPLAGKVVILAIEETHVNRPLPDPAARMAVANRLKQLGLDPVVPKDPPADWKRDIQLTGKYSGRKVDYLLEGEGVSAFAGQIQGLVSCRARVELQLTALPGKTVTLTEKGVAARVDLVEALAAKAALEDAGTAACDVVIQRLVERVKQEAPGPPAGK
jgi:TolB-like protein